MLRLSGFELYSRWVPLKRHFLRKILLENRKVLVGTSGSVSVALAHCQLKWRELGTGNPWKTRENLVGMAREWKRC